MDMDGMCYNIHIPFLGIGLSLTNNKCQLFTNLVLGGIKCKWIFQQFTMMDSCYSLLAADSSSSSSKVVVVCCLEVKLENCLLTAT